MDKYFWVTYRNPEEWIESRKEILQKILTTLSRCAYRYETEMIMCTKSCYVCFRQANIRLCSTCYSANFCDDYQILFNLFHKKYCDELLLLLNTNIAYINGCMKKTVECRYGQKFLSFPGKWFESITARITQECPLLLTAHLENIAQENVDKIEDVIGATRIRIYRKNNKFVGCPPYRNCVTGGFYYRNTHFIMYS
ncbi:uncharacterized protein LOC116850757 isoform X2 [Odontomachus brunneus]|nr:uncharacterized protein LOC116850757 isoform X2 [Odontomachus brunneus]XP_032685287.1 uncharacterized protein LOC116850757 isoform X2 [Odontomachus brunneus]